MNFSSITQAFKSQTALPGQSTANSAAPQNAQSQANISRGSASAMDALPVGSSVKATVIASAQVTKDIKQQLIHAQLAQTNSALGTSHAGKSAKGKPSNHAALQQQLSALPQKTATLLADPNLKMVKIQSATLQNWVFTSQPIKIGQKIQAIKTDSGQLLLKAMLEGTPKSGQSSNIQHANLSSNAINSNTISLSAKPFIQANTQQRQAALETLRGIMPSVKSATENLDNLTQFKKELGAWLKSSSPNHSSTPQSARPPTIQNTASDTLKPFLAQSLKSLTQNMPALSPTLSHQHIQKAFKNSGMMLEQQLFKANLLAATPNGKAMHTNNTAVAIAQTDQKALNLTVAQHLSAYSSLPMAALMSDKALQHLFKLLGLPQPNIEALKKDGSAIKLLQQLSQLTSDNVNRIRSNQISHILKQVEASAESVRGGSLSLEIPLRYNTTFIPLFVELTQKDYIQEESANNDAAFEEEEKQKQSQWEVFLTLELKQIGQLSVCIKTLSKTKHAPSISTQLWIDDAKAYSLLNTHLVDLNNALEKDGFKQNTLTCINQPPPMNKKQHIAANLIDITT